MLRRASLIAFMFCGAIALACCGRSPTAPATRPAPAGTAVRAPRPTLEPTSIEQDLQQPGGEQSSESAHRGRTKYSVIFF